MDDLDLAINRARAAAQPHPSVARHVEAAVALARFQVHAPRVGPFRHEPLSDGVPQRPTGSMYPTFAHVRGELYDALENLTRELVWAADCAEFTDANLNAHQFLCAAGHVDLAARAALELAGPGLGIVLDPPRYVRELVAAADAARVTYQYRWDMYHEAQVTDPAPRELTEYRVRLDGDVEPALREIYGEPREVEGRRRYGPFFVSDGPVLEWYADEPVWAIPPKEHDVAALVERIRTAAPLEHEFRPPIGALELARGLGAPDAFARTVDVHMSSWRLDTPSGRLKVGPWEIDASLANSPQGEPVPGLDIPASRTAVLSEDDVVRWLYVRSA
jgi:hypothetical protein